MDLGLKGRTAIVCAASQGLGKASAMALAREGVTLFIAPARGHAAIRAACPAPGMIARKFGRIVNVTSHAVKAPVAMLALSNGAHTGLTGFVAGLARSTAEHNMTINNLLPGTFDTDRLKSNLAALAKNSSREVGALTEEIRAASPTKRFGHPDEFGATCAFLCSAQAGYITGQNILIDGGAYPGTF